MSLLLTLITCFTSIIYFHARIILFLLNLTDDVYFHGSAVAFKLYDLRQTGFIEREEVSLFTDILTYIFIILVNFVCCSFIQLKEMVIALLHESELVLSEEMIEVMVDKVVLSFYLFVYISI